MEKDKEKNSNSSHFMDNLLIKCNCYQTVWCISPLPQWQRFSDGVFIFKFPPPPQQYPQTKVTYPYGIHAYSFSGSEISTEWFRNEETDRAFTLAKTGREKHVSNQWHPDKRYVD